MAELHKYTQAEFDALPIINGYRQCPTGDYSGIGIFGKRKPFRPIPDSLNVREWPNE